MQRGVTSDETASVTATGVRLSDAAKVHPSAAGVGHVDATWELKLVDVECSEAGISTTLRSLQGDYVVAWSRHPGTNSLSATLTFES